MARAQFGGADDYSTYFLQLYQNYQDRVEANARAAIREAEEEQAAADEDAMNRWQAGEMSDAEWLAYVKQRLAESTDEEDKTAWREVIRDSNEQITVRRIEDGARDLMNRIEAGTATWQDLRNFYTRERAKLQKGSEMYRQITEQIDGIKDTIRDNATNAAIGEAQYLFESGQISGAEAARRIRNAAERYRVNDPGKYYQLLSSAYDLQTYGSSSGGSGGGGGGGPRLSDTIDALEYTADAIDLLNDQFKNGKRIGTLPDGTEVPIADESGNPTATWREVDRMMIETLDAQYEAKVANGDRSAVEVLQRKEAYIENTVQPRNTIPREAQFGALTRDLERAVALRDPNAIQSALGTMERWAGRLNTKTMSTDVSKRASDEQVRENPELSAAVRRQTTGEADELEQVADEFVAQVQSTVRAYRTAFDNPAMTPEQERANLDSAPGASIEALAGLQEVSTKSNGLRDDSFVRVMYQDGTMDAVPMVSQSVVLPDGTQVRELRPDIPFDDQSQNAVQVLREVNGRPELVWAVGDYRDVQGQRMLQISDERGRAFFHNEESGAWIGLDGQETPLPFFGASKSNAQRWVNQNPEAAAKMLQSNGVDPATVDLSNLFYRSDRLITERENETNRDYAAMQNLPRSVGSGRRFPAATIEAKRPSGLAGQAGVNFGVPQEQFRGVEAMGRSLGISFGVQDRARPGVADPKLRTPSIPRVNIRAPQVRAPSFQLRQVNIRPVAPLRLPDFSSLQTLRTAQARQLAAIRNNSETGFI